jgi:hypothetical protein
MGYLGLDVLVAIVREAAGNEKRQNCRVSASFLAFWQGSVSN